MGERNDIPKLSAYRPQRRFLPTPPGGFDHPHPKPPPPPGPLGRLIAVLPMASLTKIAGVVLGLAVVAVLFLVVILVALQH
jgi:hypothetical protein